MDATEPTARRVLEPATDGHGSADVDTVIDLDELIAQHEQLDWNEVPSLSAAEAGAWTARLIEARDALEEGL